MDKIAKANRIILGKQGENGVTRWLFPITDWIADHGEGTANLFVRRPEEDAKYPVAVTREGNYVAWTINSADTEFSGSGEAELSYFVDGKLAKSITYTTIIEKSMTGIEGQKPAPPEAGYVEKIIESGVKAEASAAAAKKSEDSALASANSAIEAKKIAEAACMEAEKSEVNAKQYAMAAERSAQNSEKNAFDAVKAADTATIAEQRIELAEQNVMRADQDVQQNAETVKKETVKNTELSKTTSGNAIKAEQSATAAKKSELAATDAEKRAEMSANRAGYIFFAVEKGRLFCRRTKEFAFRFKLEKGRLKLYGK